MNSLKNFVLTLGACFAVPTYFMVVRPYTSERDRVPVAYVMEDPGSGKAFDPAEQKGLYYPSLFSGDRKRGEEIYAREGCAQCHTQVIRPAYAGIDQFKKGWGHDQSGAAAPVATRPTYMWDYLHEDFALLGQRRIGPDLANAGYRFEGNLTGLTLASDAEKINAQKAIGLNDFYLYLYAPRVRRAWSNSPRYAHLFTVRPKEGIGASDALKLPENLSPELAAELNPPAGMEIVPTSAARALASYILGLKRDAPLPVSITGAPAKQESK
ncbi:MAG: hypothetical protein EOP86_03370 [Verrucomicrobiaceae bacterium]|nr:MAG: hypothetical protein EOP86_03370 [Verrucomicrobiaceae bacterium]